MIGIMSEPHTVVPQLTITTPVSSLQTARAMAHAFIEERFADDYVYFDIAYLRKDNGVAQRLDGGVDRRGGATRSWSASSALTTLTAPAGELSDESHHRT